jgi:transcriptional regulator with XRE-family HTH domain
MNAEEKRSSRPERPDGFYELRRIVAANIRNERQRRGWSLDRVASGLAPYLGKMGASTISAWENSRHDGAKGFTVEEVYALCSVFWVTLADLFMPPVLLDMPEVEKLPGEDPPVYLANLFRGSDRDQVAAGWNRDQYDPDGVLIPGDRSNWDGDDDAIGS